ncbi:MAG: hypothetical protein ACOH16_12465 [Propionibacteriaceae bacterium]
MRDAVRRVIIMPEQDPSREPRVQYDIGQQHAGAINNVARDQYLIQQRESFLRDVAGTRTKARYAIVLGAVFFVVGFGMFAAGVLTFMIGVTDFDPANPPLEMPTPFGQKIFGVPSGLIGWAIAAVGIFVLLLGTVLHVVATARRRRVDQEYPDPRSMGRERPGA